MPTLVKAQRQVGAFTRAERFGANRAVKPLPHRWHLLSRDNSNISCRGFDCTILNEDSVSPQLFLQHPLLVDWTIVKPPPHVDTFKAVPSKLLFSVNKEFKVASVEEIK